ncbi:uncharacterized protein LOC143039229 [Oratosquilla oratoria]|uniref:uncharacterized protein LOC143039229 n=1 Tax=Oratosquilla oratoria TaxID=337810 RepID=UPI003F7604D4
MNSESQQISGGTDNPSGASIPGALDSSRPGPRTPPPWKTQPEGGRPTGYHPVNKKVPLRPRAQYPRPGLYRGFQYPRPGWYRGFQFGNQSPNYPCRAPFGFTNPPTSWQTRLFGLPEGRGYSSWGPPVQNHRYGPPGLFSDRQYTNSNMESHGYSNMAPYPQQSFYRTNRSLGPSNERQYAQGATGGHGLGPFLQQDTYMREGLPREPINNLFGSQVGSHRVSGMEFPTSRYPFPSQNPVPAQNNLFGSQVGSHRVSGMEFPTSRYPFPSQNPVPAQEPMYARWPLPTQRHPLPPRPTNSYPHIYRSPFINPAPGRPLSPMHKNQTTGYDASPYMGSNRPVRLPRHLSIPVNTYDHLVTSRHRFQHPGVPERKFKNLKASENQIKGRGSPRVSVNRHDDTSSKSPPPDDMEELFALLNQPESFAGRPEDVLDDLYIPELEMCIRGRFQPKGSSCTQTDRSLVRGNSNATALCSSFSTYSIDVSTHGPTTPSNTATLSIPVTTSGTFTADTILTTSGATIITSSSTVPSSCSAVYCTTCTNIATLGTITCTPSNGSVVPATNILSNPTVSLTSDRNLFTFPTSSITLSQSTTLCTPSRTSPIPTKISPTPVTTSLTYVKNGTKISLPCTNTSAPRTITSVSGTRTFTCDTTKSILAIGTTTTTTTASTATSVTVTSSLSFSTSVSFTSHSVHEATPYTDGTIIPVISSISDPTASACSTSLPDKDAHAKNITPVEGQHQTDSDAIDPNSLSNSSDDFNNLVRVIRELDADYKEWRRIRWEYELRVFGRQKEICSYVPQVSEHYPSSDLAKETDQSFQSGKNLATDKSTCDVGSPDAEFQFQNTKDNITSKDLEEVYNILDFFDLQDENRSSVNADTIECSTEQTKKENFCSKEERKDKIHYEDRKIIPDNLDRQPSTAKNFQLEKSKDDGAVADFEEPVNSPGHDNLNNDNKPPVNADNFNTTTEETRNKNPNPEERKHKVNNEDKKIVDSLHLEKVAEHERVAESSNLDKRSATSEVKSDKRKSNVSFNKTRINSRTSADLDVTPLANASPSQTKTKSNKRTGAVQQDQGAESCNLDYSSTIPKGETRKKSNATRAKTRRTSHPVNSSPSRGTRGRGRGRGRPRRSV